jgi:hypothetical protein
MSAANTRRSQKDLEPAIAMQSSDGDTPMHHPHASARAVCE